MREKQSYKTKYRAKILYISSKNKKIEDIFQGCLRFLDSKETNGSAPFFIKTFPQTPNKNGCQKAKNQKEKE